MSNVDGSFRAIDKLAKKQIARMKLLLCFPSPHEVKGAAANFFED